MTTPHKTMAEIFQEGIKEQEQKLPTYVVCDYSFNAGFWLRDKLGDEALKIAVEALTK